MSLFLDWFGKQFQQDPDGITALKIASNGAQFYRVEKRALERTKAMVALVEGKGMTVNQAAEIVSKEFGAKRESISSNYCSQVKSYRQLGVLDE